MLGNMDAGRGDPAGVDVQTEFVMHTPRGPGSCCSHGGRLEWQHHVGTCAVSSLRGDSVEATWTLGEVGARPFPANGIQGKQWTGRRKQRWAVAMSSSRRTRGGVRSLHRAICLSPGKTLKCNVWHAAHKPVR